VYFGDLDVPKCITKSKTRLFDEVHWMVDRFLLSALLDNLLCDAIHHGLENVLVVANGHSLRVENSVLSDGSRFVVTIG